MKMYASCPICGYKLRKGESGSDADILCPRCSKLIKIHIMETEVRTVPAETVKKT